MKHTIRLNKTELNNLIAESVRRTLKEWNNKNFRKLPYVNESREKANRLTDKILAEVRRKLKGNKKLNEQQGSGLWAEIRFVQGGDDDYEEILQMFCGDNDAYCEANAQPVIDYLKQWDSDECEITPNKPRIAKFDTSYADENGEYTLLYNSSIGGDFLLYRPANEQEIDWYENSGPGSLNESANTRYKGFKCVNTSNDPSFPTYAIVSPQGEEIGTTLFPSEMKEIVDEYLNGN